jgi:hypothetical protein
MREVSGMTFLLVIGRAMMIGARSIIKRLGANRGGRIGVADRSNACACSIRWSFPQRQAGLARDPMSRAGSRQPSYL